MHVCKYPSPPLSLCRSLSRYRSKTGAAMSKGVRDAVAYSGAVAINNWLDLGASVLILW